MSDRSEAVKCQFFQSSIRRSNMSRHVRSQHSEEFNKSNLQRSAVSQEVPGAAAPVLYLPACFCAISSRLLLTQGGLSQRLRSFVTRQKIAEGPFSFEQQQSPRPASRLLGKVSSSFSAESFPDIEQSQRSPLLVGAFSGAQFVSRMHFYAVHSSSSDDPRHRRAARNADVAISNWKLGLRVGMRPTLVMQYSSGLMAPDDVPVTSSTLRVISPPPTSSSKRLRYDNLRLPFEFRQALSDFSSTEREATPVISSPLAESAAKFLYDEPVVSGFPSSQEGSSAQAHPSGVSRPLSTGEVSRPADQQQHRLGAQAPPLMSGQACQPCSGRRPSVVVAELHGGSNGQVPLASCGPVGRQNIERPVIADLINRSPPSPEWSTQALPVSSIRHRSAVAPTTASATPGQ